MLSGLPIQLRATSRHSFAKAGSALLAATIAVVFALWAPSAHACVLCMPYPKKTNADTIVESDTVVFARENPASPFYYAPVETLKGHYDGDAIPLLVDTTTSRELLRQPALSVALAQDRPGGTWQRLALAGTEYQVVIRQLAEWTANSRTSAERAMFFAPYLRHEDRALAELAFLEVARAPYATIRDLSAAVEREDIYRVLNDWFRVEWHPLYILMLGMSDRPDDIAFIRGKLETSAKYGMTINLGAYATAFVEMVGADAVNELAETYLANPKRSTDELREILKALSVQGNGGRVELRPAIVDAYGDLLAHHPGLAGYVANDLLDWRVTRFVTRMREILNDGAGLDGASQLAVATYLTSTGENRGTAGISTPSGRLR